MDDNEGLVCSPFTATSDGVDDYENIPLFMWWNCNYERDPYGCAWLTYMEDEQGYTTSGAVDVGVIQMMMYLKLTETNDYYILSISDTQHEGYVPWVEGVTKKQGRTIVLPYYIGSKYYSGTASDGKPRSQPGLAPIRNVSYSNMITNYQTKGPGY